MIDLLAALGLTLVIEGVLFAGLPGAARRAAQTILDTPENTLRLIGLASATVGMAIVWLARG